MDAREGECRTGEMAHASANLLTRSIPDMSQFSSDYSLKGFWSPLKKLKENSRLLSLVSGHILPIFYSTHIIVLL